MKVSFSKEAKVGLISFIAIISLIIGFNFLKGKSLFAKNMILYAKYSNIQGLSISNPVIINGFQVGTVSDIHPDRDMKNLLVTIELKQEIQIPSNSLGVIIPNPLGDTKIEIRLGDNQQYLKNGDSLQTMVNKGILDDVLQRVDPVLFVVKKVAGTLDSLLNNVNSLVNAKNKNNIGSTLGNLQQLSARLLISSNSLKEILDTQSGTAVKSLNNIEKVTGNLVKQQTKINNVIDNLDKSTEKLSKAEIQNTLNILDSTLHSLNIAMSKFSSKEGSVGLMLNDQSLYKNLTASSYKLNILLDDIRMNPKRYISLSVLGRKTKASKPLEEPIMDSINTPYTKP